MRKALAVILGLGAIFAGASSALPDPAPPPALLEKARGLVALADKDKDGRVSLLEYAAAKLREANGGSGGNLRLTPKHDAYWRGLDTDKDGVITPEEFSRGTVADELRAIDVNRDGEIEPSELAQAMLRVDRADKGEKKNGFLERYDADRDGKVTRAEWPGSDEVFRRLDRNGDGAIAAADQP